MELQPLGNRVIVKVIEEEETTESGIVIPETAQDKPTEAEVIAVGPGERHNGEVIEPEVKKGDRVIFGKYSGTEIDLGGEEYLVLNGDDILAKVG